MLNKDKDEANERDRDITEYLASFINNEAVRQIREGREKQKTISDQDFGQIIRNITGRDFDPDKIKTATRAETEDTNKKPEVKRPGSISIEDIKRYTGIVDMDDVKFTPLNKRK